MKEQTSLNLNKIEVPLLPTIDAVLEVANKWRIYNYELAKACGISRITLNDWKHKGSELDAERVIRLNTGLRSLIKQKKKALENAF